MRNRRILIVEDHEAMQVLYRAAIRKLPDIEVGAITADAEGALRELAAWTPDLIIIDISLPGMDGLELTRRVRERYPEGKILVASAHERELYYQKAADAGADDMIVKGNAEALRTAVQRLLNE